jgi:hypothetical protein
VVVCPTRDPTTFQCPAGASSTTTQYGAWYMFTVPAGPTFRGDAYLQVAKVCGDTTGADTCDPPFMNVSVRGGVWVCGVCGCGCGVWGVCVWVWVWGWGL